MVPITKKDHCGLWNGWMSQLFNRIEAAFKFSILQSLSFHPFQIEKLESNKKLAFKSWKAKLLLLSSMS